MSNALAPAEIERVLAAVTGTNAVLVGGQAVNVWATYYEDRIPELREGGIYVSRDVDFQGSRDDAAVAAERLDGKLHVPTITEAFETVPINAALVEFTGEDGESRRVDFLANVHGIQRAYELHERAVPMEVGGTTVLVIDPVSQLVSRIANLTTLREGQDAAKTQAQTAVWVLREWLIDWVPEGRPGLKAIERAFDVAVGRSATRAAVLHGVEAFDAIRPHQALPEAFRTERYPRMAREVEKQRTKLRASRGDPSSGPAP